MYKGEKVMLFYINQQGTPSIFFVGETHSAEFFADFVNHNGGRALNYLEGVNSDLYAKANEFVKSLPRETNIEKIDISDILKPRTEEDSQQEE